MAMYKVYKLIDDQKLKTFIDSITDFDLPYLISETLKMLDDSSPLCGIISDSNKVALCKMISTYFDSCYFVYSDDIGLDKLLKYGKIEVYRIDARDGIRYATANEVANGVRGLIPNNIYPAGEDVYKLLCLLYWTFTGRSYYFRQAGYKLDYDKDGKVTNTLYEMIQMSARQLIELFDFVADNTKFEKSLKLIKKMKKNNGYKYANFAKDEIEETVTIKQLIYNICRAFPHNSPNADYRKALALAIKSSKNNVKLTPYEISFLRDTYYKHATDPESKNTLVGDCDEQLKSDCEILLSEQYSGKINQNHFCYKIITTLKRNNYSKCSEKQYNIIKDALNIINSKNESTETNTKTEIISDDIIDMSLNSLSNAIGNGLGE